MTTKHRIINGDCLKKLSKFEPNSIDALCTDPPAGINFMNKDWDKNRGGRECWIMWLQEIMEQCYRVLKPGAHGFVWAIPRTSHWTATALEDAGFEIRDVVTHLFGSGFPKSLNISKAIDKGAGTEREKIGINLNVKGRTDNRTAGQVKAAGNASTIHNDDSITAPATPEAKQWDGWGTALKPAMELWTLARKPLSEKTVASNVLKHGTGGINVDGGRIEGEDKQTPKTRAYSKGQFGGTQGKGIEGMEKTDVSHHEGRFPANLIHDGSDEVVSLFPETESGDINGIYNNTIMAQSIGNRDGKPVHLQHTGDSGSAARYFYCAKASREERDAGLGMTEGVAYSMSGNDSEKIGDIGLNKKINRHNFHPTVKPILLMRYLCRLITPPTGIVLDPYAGSGSTLIGAKLEGFKYIGFEMSHEFCDIAEKRIKYYNYQTRLNFD